MNLIFEKIMKRICTTFFVAIIVILLLLSLFSTTILTYGNDLFYLYDKFSISVLLTLLLTFAIVGCAIYAKRNNKLVDLSSILKSDSYYFKIERGILITMLILGITMVCAFKAGGRADDKSIQYIIYNILHGDYSAFKEGGYINRFPFNIGILSYSLLLSYVFGTYNYIAFQIINVLFVVGFYHEIVRIFDIYGMSRINQIIYLCSGLLFYPLMAFSCFAYGMIPGLYFATLAIKFTLLFLKNKKGCYGILAIISIIIGCFLKNNYYIFLLGIAVVSFIVGIIKKEWKVGLFATTVMLSLLFVLKIPTFVDLCLKDYEFVGEPIGAWIYCGMYDGERGPGWYSSDVDIYERNPDDILAQKIDTNNRISARISYFKDNPYQMYDFYLRKVASQWNCPSFDPLYVSVYGISDEDKSEMVWNWLSLNTEDRMNRIYNRFQPIVLLGTLFFVYFVARKRDMEYWILPVIFIGGFLFQLIWEARCMYTISYYILLFPMSIWGFSELANAISAGKCAIKSLIKTKKMVLLIVPFLLLSLCQALLSKGFFTSITCDNERYKQFLIDNSQQNVINAGYYYCYNLDGQSLNIDNHNEIQIITYHDESYIKSLNGDFLCWNDDGECSWGKLSEEAGCAWKIIRASLEGSYAIVNTNNEYLILKDSKYLISDDCQNEMRFWFFDSADNN